SMSSLEFLARIACALRNDRSVKILVPPRKVDWASPAFGLATITLSITWVTTLPSLRRSFCALAVLLKYGRLGWVTLSDDSGSQPSWVGMAQVGVDTS